jgi:vancomycin permeability regulator SanA
MQRMTDTIDSPKPKKLQKLTKKIHLEWPSWLANPWKLVVMILIFLFIPIWSLNIRIYGNIHDNGLQKETYKFKPQVALVLGAGLDGKKPSAALALRLDAAAKLYHDGLIQQILVSGTNTSIYYNEPDSMKTYLIKKQQIPEDKISLDYAGRRTIDSCWRAKNVFKVESLYVVTQAFHLGRATTLCRHVGLDTIPVMAKDNDMKLVQDGVIREVGASWEAVFNIYNKYEPLIQSDGSEKNLGL